MKKEYYLRGNCMTELKIMELLIKQAWKQVNSCSFDITTANEIQRMSYIVVNDLKDYFYTEQYYDNQVRDGEEWEEDEQ